MLNVFYMKISTKKIIIDGSKQKNYFEKVEKVNSSLKTDIDKYKKETKGRSVREIIAEAKRENGCSHYKGNAACQI